MILSLLQSAVAVGFPTIATYKALKANDIALMRPWLMYWSVFSLGSFAESMLGFVTRAIPFYSLLRLGGLVWLVSSGGVAVWTQYVEPYLAHHEARIDHAAKSVYARQGLGQGEPPASDPPLFSRFRLPVSPEAVAGALASSWRAPKTPEQAQEQRGMLEQMLSALDARPEEEFVAVERPPPLPGRHRWFW